MDSVLSVAYPYVSQKHGLTNLTTPISSDMEEIRIQFESKFIPVGEEDKTAITIGVMDGDMPRFVKAYIWREEDAVLVTHGSKRSVAEADDKYIEVQLDPELLEVGEEYSDYDDWTSSSSSEEDEDDWDEE